MEHDRPEDVTPPDDRARHPLPMALCGILAVVAPFSAMARLYVIFTNVNANNSANLSSGAMAYGLMLVWIGSASFLAFLLAMYRPGRRWAWWLGLAALLANAFNPYFLVFLAVAFPLWIVLPTRQHFGVS